MKKPVAFLFGAAVALVAGSANACGTLQEAMKEFEGVKNAYVAKAPSMKPEMFQVWATHIQAFGDAMGKQDYASACATLAAARTELGLGGDESTTTTAAPPPPPPPPSTTESGNATPPPPPPPPSNADTAGAAGTWTECPRGRCRN